jgi:leucyl aminopeptidase (aminopeptidase T)
MRELTADLTADDSLIVLCGNELCLRLIRVPELGGITGLLDFTRTLSAAGTHTTIDPVTEDTFVRLYAVDFGELGGFVARLRGALEGAASIHVTCPSGTDLWLTPRHWVGEETGFELYTAPLEEKTEGRIVYCSLANPTLPALIAFVEAGRVTRLLPSIGAGEVSEALRLSLERADPAVRVVAELGIGTHPGSWLVDSFPGQMENETIRGTCHLDLGDNTWFGGVNHAEQHLGGIVWHPSIATERGPVLVGAELVTGTPEERA